MNELLTVTGLAHRFDPKSDWVFKGFDFEVPEGSTTGILGPSGCGKSSLLRCLAGLLEPTVGEVRWSRPITNQCAYIFQDPTLLPWLTPGQNVGAVLKMRGVSAEDRRSMISDALEQVQLSAYADRYPRELSGGMRMRVSLARALVIQPKVLFLDEPFGALDAINRKKMNLLLENLGRSSGWTVIMVTHSVEEAVFLSDQVIRMEGIPGCLAEKVNTGRETETDWAQSDATLRLAREISERLI